MNASVERSALHLILVNFVHQGPDERARSEAAVRATVKKATDMGVLDVGRTPELDLLQDPVMFAGGPRSELMDFYLDERRKKG